MTAIVISEPLIYNLTSSATERLPTNIVLGNIVGGQSGAATLPQPIEFQVARGGSSVLYFSLFLFGLLVVSLVLSISLSRWVD